MKLYGPKRLRFMMNAFNRLIVHIAKPNLPIFGQGIVVHNITVVLTGNVTAPRAHLIHRLIVAAVAVLHARRCRTGGEGKNLMTETNAQYRLGTAQKLFDLRDQTRSSLGIAGTVAK